MFDDLLSLISPAPTNKSEIPLLRASRRAMATLFEILLPTTIPLGSYIAGEALDLIDELEAQLTVYRDDSEISQLNAHAANRAISVESKLFDLLEHSARLSKETQGAFDIATGALIKAWGFYKRQGCIPSVQERIEAMNRTGIRHVILDRESRTVRYLRTGLEINLGAIGKGYALDRTMEYLHQEWGVSCALIHGGTSSVVAMSKPDSNTMGWPIAIKHPWEPDRRLGTIFLENQALGTSAATYQYFEYNGRKLGHLLDPRTGWPAETVAQVSVVAPTATDADALSTAFFVLGLEATKQYCQANPTIGAIVLPQDESGPVVINIPKDQWQDLK